MKSNPRDMIKREKPIGIVFLIITIFLLSCNSDQSKSVQTATNQEFPDQESWNATVLITRNGKTVGVLKAGHVQKFSKKNITLLDDSIRVDFYDEQGHHKSVLTALGGKVNDINQDMEAYGHVKVVSDSGLTLYTDTLKWDNRAQKIYSEVPIMLTTSEDDTLYGDKFKSSPDLMNYEIENPRGKSSKKINIE